MTWALDTNTDLVGGIRVAEKIRLAVTAANQLHAGSPSGQLTVSIGVAALYEDATSSQTIEQLVHEADQMLYEAKALGRNMTMPQEASALAGMRARYLPWIAGSPDAGKSS
ncbi:hypothetical protein LMG19083_04776 [Ralstonia psammae]|uniref:diguanylate cyclase n=1 Tax=Ralstonia psammae TaxID=3058598 RepID=A0ABM9JYS4_9RALS|nr:diguanylate cyclase [Ralstonia sp. LMG 19083]CAJ0808805.1 hypothetical protein LMG19083_04776 [Ralstonia sp. LMG 19083]